MKIKSKYKVTKFLGKNLWNLRGIAMRRHVRLSNYRVLLSLKNTVKRQYGPINEKQFKSYFNRQQGIYRSIESRLDSLLYRMHLSRSIFNSRQDIVYGLVYVNGAKITSPSYQVNKGDIIQMKPCVHLHKKLVSYVDARKVVVPSYIEINYRVFSGIYLGITSSKDIPINAYVNPNSIKLSP